MEVKSSAGFEVLKIIKLTNPNAEIVTIFNPKDYDKNQIICCGVMIMPLKPFLLSDVGNIGKKALEKSNWLDKVRNLEQIRIWINSPYRRKVGKGILVRTTHNK